MSISCAADRVHLLADDLLDLPVDAPAERQERPQAGADLADEAAAHEQLVADRLGVRRRRRAGSAGRAVTRAAIIVVAER